MDQSTQTRTELREYVLEIAVLLKISGEVIGFATVSAFLKIKSILDFRTLLYFQYYINI